MGWLRSQLRSWLGVDDDIERIDDVLVWHCLTLGNLRQRVDAVAREQRAGWKASDADWEAAVKRLLGEDDCQ